MRHVQTRSETHQSGQQHQPPKNAGVSRNLLEEKFCGGGGRGGGGGGVNPTGGLNTGGALDVSNIRNNLTDFYMPPVHLNQYKLIDYYNRIGINIYQDVNSLFHVLFDYLTSQKLNDGSGDIINITRRNNPKSYNDMVFQKQNLENEGVIFWQIKI